jgi:DNA repair exonuclease SbcCD nuclease subunit
MRCLITGDWHLGLLTHGVQQPDGFNSRMSDIKLVVTDLLKRCEGYADCFIHLGDLFHTNTPSPAALATAADIFGMVVKQFKHKFLIGGNHDYAVTRVNPVDIFSRMFGLECMTSPKSFIFGKDELIFIPHTNEIDVNNYLQSLSKVGHISLKRTVFCHTTFSGALTGSENFMLSAGVHSIPRDLAGTIFSGHIHKAQVLRSNQDGMADVYYPGSPMVLDFGERNDKKIALLYDTETGLVQDVDLLEPRKFIQLETIDENRWPNLQNAVVKIVMNSAEQDSERLTKTLKSRGVHSIAGIHFVSNTIVEKMKESALKLDDKQLMWDYLQKLLGEDAKAGWDMAWSLISSAGVEVK